MPGIHLNRSARLLALHALTAVALLAPFVISTSDVFAIDAYSHEVIEHDLEFDVIRDGERFHVSIGFYLDANATPGDIEAAAAATKARFAGIVPTIESEPGSVSAQFALVGPSWTNRQATWWYNVAGETVNASTALRSAAATWNGAGSGFQFFEGGSTTAATGACSGTSDGRNTVGWRSQAGEVLAMTCSWDRDSASGGREFAESDIEIDPRWAWSTSTSGVSYDIESVLLHELGHALGLDHTAVTCPGSTMCSSYASGSLLRTLLADDLTGLRAIYGTSTAPTASPQVQPLPQTRGPFRIIALGTVRGW